MKSVKLLFPKSANKEFSLNSTSAVSKYCAIVKNYNNPLQRRGNISKTLIKQPVSYKNHLFNFSPATPWRSKMFDTQNQCIFLIFHRTQIETKIP